MSLIGPSRHRVTPILGTLLFLAGTVLLGGTAADGEQPPGTLEAPIQIERFPFLHDGTTEDQPHIFDRYSCAPQVPEGGGEVVYQMTLTEPGQLQVMLEDSAENVDVDVHLLSSGTVGEGMAEDCQVRGNRFIRTELTAATYLLVVDSKSEAGLDQSGPFRLQVDFTPADRWREIVVADGVIWRSRHYSDLFGGAQLVNLLEVDLLNPEVTIGAVEAADSCETTSSMGQRTGAIAGVNGGFFCLDTDCLCAGCAVQCPAGCEARSLLKLDGELLSTNCQTQGNTARTSLGIAGVDAPAIRAIGPGADWPGTTEAIGAGPNLVSESPTGPVINVTDEGFPWMEELDPRTSVGLTADGKMLLVTFDGRRASALGVTIFQLANYMLELGAVGAMNLDGGGSTTMYVAGYGWNGVVNRPSDQSERPVHDGVFIYAPALQSAGGAEE